MSLEIDESELFHNIIDPETNQKVLLESAIGQQVIKNYIECLRNGPDSENIVSTKMFYPKNESNKTETGDQRNNLSVENIYEYAKKLDDVQYSGKELKNLIKGSHKKTPNKGNKVWIRRSNGKWQRSVISNVVFEKDTETVRCDVYFNAGDNKIASKKGLDVNDILLY